MTLPIYLVIVCVVLFYVAIPISLVIFIKNTKTLKILFSIFFSLFLAILFVCTIGKIDISKTSASLSFDFSQEWCNKTINFMPFTKSLVDIGINIAMLFPVGLFVFAISKKKTWQKLLLCLLFGAICGLVIETYQFILPVSRSVQLSDIISNSISALLGGLFMWGILSIKNLIHKKRTR